MKGHRWLIGIVAGAPLFSACGDCAGVGLSEVRPGRDVSLAVGQSFTAEYLEGASCGPGSDHLTHQDMRWSSADSIVQVDSLTGLVRALAPGDAQIRARLPGLPATPEAMS